jgi:ribosomal protein S18 acetylase RimI-like enzyme
MSDAIIARRLRVNEVHLLELLNDHECATFYWKNFLHHGAWVERMVSEVASGLRVAIIANASEHPSLHLLFDTDMTALPLGSVILTRGAYSNEVELKNLIVRKGDREAEVAQALLSHSIAFSEKRGFRRIIAVVPIADSASLRHYLDFGFRIEAPSERWYGAGSQSMGLYQMSLQLDPAYVGDPYDLLVLTTWILKTRFGFSVQPPVEVAKSDETGSQLFTINFEAASRPSSASSYQALRGNACIAVDPPDAETLLEHLGSIGEDVCFLFGPEIPSAVLAYAKEHRIRVIGADELNRLCESPRNETLERSEVGGLLTFLRRRYSDSLKLHAGSAAYVVRSGLGRYIPNDGIIVFASEDVTQARATFQIFGYAQIASPPLLLRPESVLNGWPKNYVLWTRTEFELYFRGLFANENPNRDVCLLELEKITMFHEPFDATHLVMQEGLDPVHLRERSTDVYVSSHFTEALIREVDEGRAKAFAPTGEQQSYASSLLAIIQALDESKYGHLHETHRLIEHIRSKVSSLLKAAEPKVEFIAIAHHLTEEFKRRIDLLMRELTGVTGSERYTGPEKDREISRLASEAERILGLLPPPIRNESGFEELQAYLTRIRERFPG